MYIRMQFTNRISIFGNVSGDASKATGLFNAKSKCAASEDS